MPFRKNHETRTDLYNKTRAKLVEEAKGKPLGHQAHEAVARLDSIQNAPSLYSDIGKVVKKVFSKKSKTQAAPAIPTATKTPVKPVVKDPGKPVDEKRTPTEPIDVVGHGNIELIPPIKK